MTPANIVLDSIFLYHKPVTISDSQTAKAFWQQELSEHYHFIQLDGHAQSPSQLISFNPTFLNAARQGSLALALATLQIAQPPAATASCRSLGIAAGVTAGHARILSPFSGVPEAVTASLGLDWSLHSHEERYCLASQMGATMIAVSLETVWVFPQDGLVLYIGNGLPQEVILDNIAKNMSLWMERAEKLADYLCSTQPRKICVTDFWCPHMSHNLWNIQTGWANVFDRCSVDKIDEFMLFSGQNFFGDLAELYPDLITDREKIKYISQESDILDEMLIKNLLLFCVKDENFTKSFADRVLHYARQSCSPEFLAEVQRLKTVCKPLVVTTVRLDNREWLEQREGFPALFKNLQETFPNIGLIIDGLSSDTAKGWTTGWMSLEAELAMANAIRHALPAGMEVALAVGKTFFESIVLCDAADLFIAPSGSGMALYKWLSNIQGIAFSNRSVLDAACPHSWPLRVWHNPAFRADITPTLHLVPELVDDVPSSRDHVSRNNFHMDWQRLVTPSVELIKTLGF
jgi:hypothetical protein